MICSIAAGDNATGADNQQERLGLDEDLRKGWIAQVLDVKKIPPEVGWYLAGFADGEGSFIVVFRPRKDGIQPWKVSLRFHVSQDEKEILAQFKRYLDCGSMRRGEEGLWHFEVNNFNAIRENVIPFFDKFRFRSAKNKRDFSKFKRIASIMATDRHLQREGIQEILKIREGMSGGGKRKYDDKEILYGLEGPESSETTRQALSAGEQSNANAELDGYA